MSSETPGGAAGGQAAGRGAAGGPASGGGAVPADPGPATHPNLPRRGALALTFAAIVVCGVLGGGIGYGIVHATCPSRPTVGEQLLETVPGFHAHAPECGLRLLGAALVGTAMTGIGAGVVAMLMLRAQSEWRAHPASRRRAAPAPVRPPRAGGTPPRR